VCPISDPPQLADPVPLEAAGMGVLHQVKKEERKRSNYAERVRDVRESEDQEKGVGGIAKDEVFEAYKEQRGKEDRRRGG